MHVLLDDQAFLRVCVCSANLGQQWSYSRDVLWVQDFRVPGAGRPLNTQFYHDLARFCQAIAIPPDVMQPILQGVSFESAGATLIPSVPESTQRRRHGDAASQPDSCPERKSRDQPPLLYQRGDHGHIYLRHVGHLSSSMDAVVGVDGILSH